MANVMGAEFTTDASLTRSSGQAADPKGPPTRGQLLAGIGCIAAAIIALWGFYQGGNWRQVHLWSILASIRPLEIVFGETTAGPWIALTGGWLLTMMIGGLVLRAANVVITGRWEVLATSYVLGLGVLGYVGMILTLAHQLSFEVGWGVIVALVSMLVLLGRRSFASWPATWWETPEFEGTCAKESRAGIAFTVMTGVLVFLGFYFAVFFPVVYWDAMILYVGYARMTYLEEGVVERVVGQVGIGLGANYTHLMEWYHILITKLAGQGWTSIHAQAVSPLCMIATLILTNGTLRRLGFRPWVRGASLMLLMACPYVIAYTQYASNYLTAVAYVALFLWAAARWIERRDIDSLVLCFVAAIFAANVNYLMWLLWLSGLVLVTAALGIAPRVEGFGSSVTSLWKHRRWHEIVVVSLLLASPWYVRNVVVTGNPVYAFFYSIFPSKHVNPDVMRSCDLEWRANGDGIGIHAMQHAGTLDYTMADKMAATPRYLLTGDQAYKVAPMLLGFTIPGLVLALNALRRRTTDQEKLRAAMTLVAGSFFLMCWAYHYGVADYYLYQILPFIACAPIFTAYALTAWHELGKFARAAAAIYLTAVWLVPGVAFGVMGFKGLSAQGQLTLFHHPLMESELVYRLHYPGGDVPMWNYINKNLRHETILTHENRHLAYDPSIHFVHLDDWETQALYELPSPEAKLRALVNDLGLKWYLRVPNEAKHPINRRLELEHWMGTPMLEEVFHSAPGDPNAPVLYRMHAPPK